MLQSKGAMDPLKAAIALFFLGVAAYPVGLVLLIWNFNLGAIIAMSAPAVALLGAALACLVP